MLKLSANNQNEFNLTSNESTKFFGGGGVSNGGSSNPMRVTDDLFDPNNLTFSPALTIFIAIVAVLMSSVTIIGNVFVITAFIIEKGLRKYSNYFILNLSIADLLIGILIPPYAPFLLYKRHWKIGRIACTIWLVLDYVVGSASVLCIVVISLDRYLLVSRGLNYVSSQKISKAICIMITVWAIAFLNYAPAIVFWEFISGRRTVQDGECQVEFHDNLVYLTATACVEFFVPLISICTLNLAVYLNIRKRSRGLIRSENPKFNLEKSTTATKAQASVRINQSQTVKETVFTTTTTNTPPLQSNDLNKIDEIKTTKNQNGNDKAGNNNKISISSTTSSSSSLDDHPVVKTKRNSKEKSKLNEDENLLDDKAKSNRKKSVTHIMVKQANETLVGVSTANTNPTNTINSAQITAAKTFNKITPAHNNNKASRSALTKDKKAARSLFILVFVFVTCWVSYSLILYQFFSLVT